ncbi:MAG: hypothetical protein WC166_05500 [Bacteroidales bacterium]
MTIDDFDRLSLPEFAAVMEAATEREKRADIRTWEAARFVAMFALQPYSKKRIKATDLCRFPWEEEYQSEENEETNIKELRERFKKVIKEMS